MKEFKEIILQLQKRKKMLVRGDSFFNLCDFIMGYGVASQMLKNQAPDREFYNWFIDKYNIKVNQYWPDIIYDLKDKNDAQAEFFLFELLEEFFVTRNDSESRNDRFDTNLC